jgi:hypothetical protein
MAVKHLHAPATGAQHPGFGAIAARVPTGPGGKQAAPVVGPKKVAPKRRQPVMPFDTGGPAGPPSGQGC